MLWCTVACHLMGLVTPRSLSRSAKVATVDPTPPQVNLYNAHDSVSIISNIYSAEGRCPALCIVLTSIVLHCVSQLCFFK